MVFLIIWGGITVRAWEEERFDLAARALSDLRHRQRTDPIPVLVEGRRDRRTLASLGIVDRVIVLNRGWPIERVLASIAQERTRFQGLAPGPVELLMDWDRTGGRLQQRLRSGLESLDVAVLETTREILIRSLTPETRTIEGLIGWIEVLSPKMTIEDRRLGREPFMGSERDLP